MTTNRHLMKKATIGELALQVFKMPVSAVCARGGHSKIDGN